jgi:hypothetical protein
MSDNLTLYRLVRLFLSSGTEVNLALSQMEIINLATALHQQKNGISHVTLFFDGPDEKVNFVISLANLAVLQVDEKDLDQRGLQLAGYQGMGLFKEPTFLRKLSLRFKWWREDRVRMKEENELLKAEIKKLQEEKKGKVGK